MQNSGVSQVSQEDAVRPAEPQRKYGLLSALRSYFFLDLLIWSYTLFFGFLSIPFGFFDKDGSVLHAFARAWAKLTMKSILSPFRVTGLDHIDTTKPHVYAVNHASALDIPALYAFLPFQFRIVHKKELWSYPDGAFTPVVTDGQRLYVVGWGKVYAFSPRTGLNAPKSGS